jgi:S1-C subfamily serine protease
MTSKTIALALAGVAVALAGTALIVVATRPHATASALESYAVSADDVTAIERDPGTQFTPQGARVGDAGLATRLHLQPGDVIVALSGRPLRDRIDVHRVIALDGKEMLAELARGSATVFERWQISGDLHTSSVGSGAVPVAPPLPDPLLDTIVRDDDTHVHLPRATVEVLLADPTALGRAVRIVPAIKNGAPSGFKLYAIRPNSVAARIGLENGDTIEEINGLPLATPESALEAYTTLRHAVHLDVAIERRGKPFGIAIQIN